MTKRIVLKVFAIALFGLPTRFANAKSPIERSDLSFFYPMQFYTTTVRTTGKSNPAFNFVGFGAMYALQFSSDVAAFFEYEANINTVNGARIFSGPSLGARYYVWGKTGMQASEKSTIVTNESIYRVALLGGVAQRSFDFRSLITTQTSRDLTNVNQGDFWGYQAGFHFDYLMKSGLRPGLLIKYLKSTPTSNKYILMSGYDVALTLDFTDLVVSKTTEKL